jgi:diguanylate cyclase (GGDEF)-like protein/PAS domain S-box-containing protein
MTTGKSRLRAKAEQELARVAAMGMPNRPVEELLHELQVHQIELEMQNEELQRSQVALEESRDGYLSLYEFAPVGYLTLTDKGLISGINLTGATLLGEDRKKLLQRRFARFVARAGSEPYHRFIVQVLHHDEPETCELALQRTDGSVLQARLDCVRIQEAGEAPAVRMTLTDVTERTRAEAELRVAATAFESQEGMVVTDAATTILRANQAFTDITGFTAEEVVGRTPQLFKSGRHDAEFYAGMWKDIARTGEWRGEITNLHKSGKVYPAWLTITAVKDDAGEITHFVGTLIDITQRKSAETDIEQLAFYDPMTRLPNRRLLLDRLQQALSARDRSAQRGAILFVDLDDFKSLNDTLGHEAGDLLLQQVALRLLGCVRACDTVARLGGDEFVVLLGDLSANPKEAASQAEIVGEKILLALAPPTLLAGHEYRSTGCIGITLFSDHRENVGELLKRADLAMYRAKAVGPSTLRFFDPEMQAAVTARLALEADLRSGMQQGQFLVHYQPQVDREGRVTGAEALVRWQHPRLGLVAPAEFIPLAEETGLIQPLGQHVLELVCRQILAWSASPCTAQLNLAMNVSAREFRRPEFVSRVLAVIDRVGADPGRLMLEFTESLLVDDTEETIGKMTALKARGVRFSLDDFGTGYSSLSYLKRLPLDQLKIDRSFVRDILVDSNDAAIARTILALGHSLGLAVVAEGIESEGQRALLAGQGCEAFQGFHFGRPGPVADLRVMAES